MTYFIDWANMREAGSLEPKPGIPPTPTHLAELVERMKRNPAKAVVYSPYNNPGAAQFLSQRANIPVVPLPFTVGGTTYPAGTCQANGFGAISGTRLPAGDFGSSRQVQFALKLQF